MLSTADVVVIGAGPAGQMAAAHAAELGARTVLVSQHSYGGMAANDGPVPVRTLAHTAYLMRNARQLGQYGVVINEPALDFILSVQSPQAQMMKAYTVFLNPAK